MEFVISMDSIAVQLQLWRQSTSSQQILEILSSGALKVFFYPAKILIFRSSWSQASAVWIPKAPLDLANTDKGELQRGLWE